MKVSIFIFVTLFVSMFALGASALECKDFEKPITLLPKSVDVGDGPQALDSVDFYNVIQADCSTNVFTVSEYSIDKGKTSLELQYKFSIGKTTSDYKYILYPEINGMVANSVLGLFIGDTLEIRDTSVQVNKGKMFPQDASLSQIVFTVKRDPKSKKWVGINTDYIYFEQK